MVICLKKGQVSFYNRLSLGIPLYYIVNLYIYMCVCVCVCVRAWQRACVHACVCVCMHTYVWMHVWVCVCVCVCAHVFAYMYMHMHVCVMSTVWLIVCYVHSMTQMTMLIWTSPWCCQRTSTASPSAWSAPCEVSSSVTRTARSLARLTGDGAGTAWASHHINTRSLARIKGDGAGVSWSSHHIDTKSLAHITEDGTGVSWGSHHFGRCSETCYKKLFTHAESHESTVSLFEGGE